METAVRPASCLFVCLSVIVSLVPSEHRSSCVYPILHPVVRDGCSALVQMSASPYLSRKSTGLIQPSLCLVCRADSLERVK
jgi:hypothetical protein